RVIVEGVRRPLHLLFVFRDGLALLQREQFDWLMPVLAGAAADLVQHVCPLDGGELPPLPEGRLRRLDGAVSVRLGSVGHFVEDLLRGGVLYGDRPRRLALRPFVIDPVRSHVRCFLLCWRRSAWGIKCKIGSNKLDNAVLLTPEW